jgi:hypothetical protein
LFFYADIVFRGDPNAPYTGGIGDSEVFLSYNSTVGRSEEIIALRLAVTICPCSWP